MPIYTDKLITTAIDALQDRKGTDITVIDLSQMEGASSQAYVLATGRSTSQVDALAESVCRNVREKLGDRPAAIHGQRNSQWVIVDFGSVAVHVFLPDIRQYYDLEGLWSDAPTERIPDLD